MKFRLLMLLFISIFLISFVSAIDWDNVVIEGNINPNTGYPNLEIKNVFGLGETLFEGKLQEHTKSCGIDCYSKMEFTHSGGVLIDDIEFRTIQDDGSYVIQSIRDYNFEYEAELPEYETQCEIINETENCITIQIGTYNGFKEYIVGDELPEGNYELYLRGEKKPMRTVDWIIKIQGKWLDEWAVWGSEKFIGEEYQLLILAEDLIEARLEINTVIITPIGNDYYKMNTSNSNNEISRALIMKTLFYGTNGNDPRATNTSLNASWIFSNDIRDNGKRGIYSAISSGGDPNANYNYDGIFANNLTNDDVSSWSTVGGSGSVNNGDFFLNGINLNTADGSTTSNEYGTDTSADDVNNPINTKLFISHFISGGYGANAIILTKGSITWSGASGASPINTDFFLEEKFPEIIYPDGNIVLNSPENNYISSTNLVDFNSSATATGGATVQNISLWTNKSGTWEINSSFNSILDDFEDGSLDNTLWSYVNSASCSTGTCSAFSDETTFSGELYMKSETDPSGSGNNIATAYMTQNFGTNWTDNILIANYDYSTRDDYQSGGPSHSSVSISLTGSVSGSISIKNWASSNVNTLATSSSNNRIKIIRKNANEITWYEDTGSGNFGGGTDVDITTLVGDLKIKFYTKTGTSSSMWDGESYFRIKYINAYPNDWLYYNDSFEAGLFTSVQITEPTLWGIQACDSDGDCGFSENRTVLVDTIGPIITFTSPLDIIEYISIGNNLSLNWEVSDINLDTCWFDYNSINTTVTCGDNNYSFITIAGQQSLIFYSNDTVGNLGSNTTNWTYTILENNVTFTAEIFESEVTTITGNFTLSSSPSSVALIYNGTSYVPSVVVIDGDNIFVANVVTPIMSSTQNISFYYLIDIDGEIQTQSHNQTILNIDVSTTCPSNFDIINITNYDEISVSQISGSVEFILNLLNSDEVVTETLFGNSTGETVQFCSTVNLSLSSSLYNMQLRYHKDGYTFKTYNIENTNVDTLPIAVNLYYLNESFGTEFRISYKDFLYIEHPGAIIQIQKQYIEENLFRVVEIPRLSDDGTIAGSFSTDNILYKLIFIEDGVILDIFNDVFPKCQNLVLGTCNIILLGSGDDGLINGDDFNYNIEQGDMEITLTFVIPSGEPKTVQLITNQSSRFLDDISSCVQSSFASGGTLTCPYNNTVGDSSLAVTINTDGELKLQGSLLISEDINALFLGNNYFIAFIMLTTLTTMFIASGSMMVLSAVIGVFYLGFIFLIRMNSLNVTLVGTSLMWLIIAGGVLIYRISQKEER